MYSNCSNASLQAVLVSSSFRESEHDELSQPQSSSGFAIMSAVMTASSRHFAGILWKE